MNWLEGGSVRSREMDAMPNVAGARSLVRSMVCVANELEPQIGSPGLCSSTLALAKDANANSGLRKAWQGRPRRRSTACS